MYYNKGIMKKIFAVLLCVLYFVTMPISAFAEYDFSDEAQEKFDRQYNNQQNNYSFDNTNYMDLESRTNYSPNPSNHSKTKGKKNKNELLYDESTNQAIEQPNSRQNIKLEQYPSNDKLYGSVVHIPAGVSFDVTFDSGISSGSTAKNDRLTVRLAEDIIYNGYLIAPAGSLVYGMASDATSAGYAYGSAAIELNFSQIMTPVGTLINISAKPIVLKSNSARAAKVTRDVVVGALGSLLIGAAFTALSGSNNWGRNMAIYGGIGALGGGIHAATQRGEEIQIPDGTTVKVTLKDALSVSPYRGED